jgi:hypothetical protein
LDIEVLFDRCFDLFELWSSSTGVDDEDGLGFVLDDGLDDIPF